jgi:hypothetical protein
MTPILGIMASSISGSKISTTAYESIASASGTGSSATITFSSIPSTYASLQIRINGRSDAAVDTTYIQVQYNATAMTKGHYLRGDGVNATAGAVNVPFYVPGGNTSANIMGVAIVDIHDYASTTRNKTGRSFGGWNGNNVYGTTERLQVASFFLDNTSAISALSFVLGNGNWTTDSTVSLYGIKGA